ncbi:hypothetical protein [Halococcus salifodinae]|jgi:hypothetical protein|uniref:Resolvase domain protein n=1 Tax=Halococcus salifodinae DSM 8989 TaxID=1227456 RepID=M0NAH2_9EURY|nr:Resolvase domain protein [Halococcus salifodinae DSM 8989]
MYAIRKKYDGSEQDSQIDWYWNLNDAEALTSRWKYQRLRKYNFSSEGAGTNSLIQILRKGYDPPLANSS